MSMVFYVMCLLFQQFLKRVDISLIWNVDSLNQVENKDVFLFIIPYMDVNSLNQVDKRDLYLYGWLAYVLAYLVSI